MTPRPLPSLTSCLLLVASAGPAYAAPPVTRIAPEQFAIMPWDHTPPEPDTLATLYDCGFNLAGFVAPDGLDAVQAARLKAIVGVPDNYVTDALAKLPDDEIAARVAELVAKSKGHPALFGYNLCDEPSATIFGGLARWADAYRAADPAARVYVNLFPTYASPQQLGVPDYAQYVDSFVAAVKPPFISYDHYALMEDGSLRDGYFQNLELIRAAALRNKLPFWNVVLAVAHFAYAEPSDAGFRFQAYTSLAYGARGIGYYTYFSRTAGNYRLAPIGHFGEKTPTWNKLRRVNLQLHQLAPIYVTLKSVNVFHHPDVPRGAGRITNSRFVDQLSGGRFVVGEFEAPDATPFVLIVNKDLHRSCAFKMTFKPQGRVYLTNARTGRTHPIGPADCWLAPGQGMLLSIRP
jgi:hypothetical protein